MDEVNNYGPVTLVPTV